MLYRVFLDTNIYDERPIRFTILHFRRCENLLRKGTCTCHKLCCGWRGTILHQK